MKPFLASHILAIFMLGISFQSVVWLSYSLNVDYITERFCINKAKAELHCNGKCHINKVLNKPSAQNPKPIPHSESLIQLKLTFTSNLASIGFANPTNSLILINRLLYFKNRNWLNPHLEIFTPPPEFKV